MPLILDPCQDKLGFEIQILVRNNHEKHRSGTAEGLVVPSALQLKGELGDCSASYGFDHQRNRCSIPDKQNVVPPHAMYIRCPYTYESGSRVRLGELDSGARLGYISPLSGFPNFACTFQYPE